MTQAQKLSTFSQALMVSPLTFRNRLINGAGTINQRGYASGTPTTAPYQYTLDRWRVVVSGQALIYAASGADVVMTAPAGGIEQLIEGAFMEGGDYTLSWVGTATATVNGTPISSGTYITLPPATTAVVRFSGGTFQNAQLEPGRIATVFERRMGLELLLCQRYYCVVAIRPTLNTNSGTVAVSASAIWPVTMRATPTATLPNYTVSFLDIYGITAFASTAGSSWTSTGAAIASAEL